MRVRSPILRPFLLATIAGVAVVVALASGAVGAAPARAAASAPAGAPKLDVGMAIVPDLYPRVVPARFHIDGEHALAVAEHEPKMLAIHRQHHPLHYRVFVWIGSHYEIYFWWHKKIIADAVVGPGGKPGPVYTGPLIFGVYARGHFGQIFDSPWVWGTLGLAFMFPLLFLRRRSWWDLVDLAVVLSFGVSYAVFDATKLELAVWLAMPPLLYLMVRMLIRGLRPRARPAIECRLPVWLLGAGLLALVAARVWLSLEPSQVMDVGEASASGAYKILHGQSIYYPSVGHGDTYGPIAYLLYAPFQLIWPGTRWTSYLTSVRAANITFDLITVLGLVALGVRLRGRRDGLKLGLLLAWLWAACPFSALDMVKNTNDGIVAMFAVLILLAFARPVARGVLVGLATAAKFFPAILLALAAVGDNDRDRGRWRHVLAGLVIAAGVSIALFLPPGGLKEVWDHTLGYQLTRPDVFSIWALHPSLSPLKVAVAVAVAAIALRVAWRPRGPRTLAQISALSGALVVGTQLPALHWFYLYIVWFLPFVLVAVLAHDSIPARADGNDLDRELAIVSETPAELAPAM